MPEHGKTAANGSPEATITVGQRWRSSLLDDFQKWLPARRWLQFAAAVEERHLAAFERSTLKRRHQGQRPAANSHELGDGPSGLALSDLMGSARLVAGTNRRPAEAPVWSYRANRHIRRAGSWPDTEANLPRPGTKTRTAVPRRSVTANSQGAAAGARAGDGRIDERLPSGALHGLARMLDSHVQGYLSGLLDLRIPAVRIHTGQAADAAARRFNADAVSFGPSIMFRAGKFAPDRPSGLALLGHELTHVAHTYTGSDRFAGSSDRAALAREELAALENERRVLQDVTSKPAEAAKFAPVPREAASHAARNTPAPRAAAVDRPTAPAAEGGLSGPPELSPQQLGALKEAIYRDLMDRIRTEFERGA